MHTQVVISTYAPRGGLLGSQEELNDPVTSSSGILLYLIQYIITEP